MMIARGCFILTVLANYVLSLPMTVSHLENEDVEVMKCIVEVLADVLSRPHPLPVSQECLDTLRTDERLVSILRHRNFLKELQDIAVQGASERAQQHGDITADHVTKAPQGPQGTDAPDRSMLAALGGPGERSILAHKRGKGEGEGEKEEESTEKDRESQEGNEIEVKGEEKREKDENPGNHISDSMNQEEEEEVGGVVEKKGEEDEEEEEEEEEEKRASSEKEAEEETEKEKVIQSKIGAESSEAENATLEKSEEKKSAEEEEVVEDEEEDKRSASFLHDTEAEKEGEEEEEEEEGEMKRESGGRPKHWSRMSELAMARSLQAKKRAGEEERQEVKSLEVRGEQEAPHHSKEVLKEGDEKRRSPEVKELQMMARREPEERREVEEEGSASRKTEDPEIESLAAIESELESVAQKLHELRRG